MKATLQYSVLLAAAALVLPSCSSSSSTAVTEYPVAAPQQVVYVAPVKKSNKISDVERKHRELVRQMNADVQKDIAAEKKEHEFVKMAAPELYDNKDYQWGHGQLLTDENRKANELRKYPR